MSFQLHPQLAADTHLICRAENCQILLMDDARFPWIVLVPEVAGIRELYELNERQQQKAYQSILHVSKSLAEYSNAEKIERCRSGNQVPQLHIHIIARYQSDVAWPGPVWGVGQTESYSADQLQQTLRDLGTVLS